MKDIGQNVNFLSSRGVKDDKVHTGHHIGKSLFLTPRAERIEEIIFWSLILTICLRFTRTFALTPHIRENPNVVPSFTTNVTIVHPFKTIIIVLLAIVSINWLFGW